MELSNAILDGLGRTAIQRAVKTTAREMEDASMELATATKDGAE